MPCNIAWRQFCTTCVGLRFDWILSYEVSAEFSIYCDMGTQHFRLEIISYFMNDQPVLCYFQGLHNTFLKTLRNKEKEDIWINGKCNILIVTMVSII